MFCRLVCDGPLCLFNKDNIQLIFSLISLSSHAHYFNQLKSILQVSKPWCTAKMQISHFMKAYKTKCHYIDLRAMTKGCLYCLFITLAH